jgi:hypothetical protein
MFKKPLALKSKLSISWIFQTHHSLVHGVERSKNVPGSHDHSYTIEVAKSSPPSSPFLSLIATLQLHDEVLN